ncbi:ATP-dependent RNA helicase RhlE [Carpediemonas membranifera]|uniref:ATP-dependent RNA helicase RhlE n=1 Tax=Carpediemonas membranifera TaxID=201153 RepID=A0A8J6E497_9EUKA|nr:ATP-dependent RNA helicase RhlE [Carpediemonas membranifera]|eukprot:KAG9396938.1 ATP-dependent RNA helicase RhlE [Carpediemonas membranifera]
MTNVPGDSVELLERWILSRATLDRENDAQLAKVLETVPSNGPMHAFIRILTEQLKSGSKTQSSKEKQLMKDAVANFGRDNPLIVILSRRRLLLSYDSGSHEDQDALLAQLTSDLQLETRMAAFKEPLAARSDALPSAATAPAPLAAFEEELKNDPENCVISDLAAHWVLSDVSRLKLLSRRRVGVLLDSARDIATAPHVLDAIVYAKGDKKAMGVFNVESSLSVEQLENYARMCPEVTHFAAYHQAMLASMSPDVPTGGEDPFADEIESYHSEIWRYTESKIPAQLQGVKLGLQLAVLAFFVSKGKEAEPAVLDKIHSLLTTTDLALDLFTPHQNAGNSRQSRIEVDTDSVSLRLLPPFNLRPLVVTLLTTAVVHRGPDPYRAKIRSSVIDSIVAEQAILTGGDVTSAAEILGHAKVREITTRVELEVRPIQRWRPGDDVTLEVDVKNVPELTARVFEINAKAYYASRKTELTADVGLEGFKPNSTSSIKYSNAAAIKHRERVSVIPKAARGSYIIELVGGGLSCRVLAVIGHYQLVTAPSVHGLVATVIDETGKVVPDAIVTVGGRELETDSGVTVIPFTTSSGSASTPAIAHTRDGPASLTHLTLPVESYHLSGSFIVPHGALLPGHRAIALPCVYLTVNGVQQALDKINQPTIRTVCIDSEGTEAVRVVKPDLSDPGLVVDLAVPPNMRSVAITLEGRIKVMSTGKWQNLTLTTSYDVATNSGSTDAVQPFVRKDSSRGWVAALKGLNGEAVVGERVSVLITSFVAPDFHCELQTDEQGEIALGDLALVKDATISFPTQRGSGKSASLTFNPNQRQWMPEGLVVAKEGEDVAVALSHDSLDELSSVFLERLREGVVVRRIPVAVETPANTVLTGLTEGSYRLMVRTPTAVYHREVRVVKATATLPGVRASVLVGRSRIVEETQDDLAIEISAARSEDSIKIEAITAGFTESTVIHVTVDPILPRWLPETLVHPHIPAPAQTTPAYPMAQVRNAMPLSKETLYVLNRQAQTARHGVTLPQPELLVVEKEAKADEPCAEPCERGGYGGRQRLMSRDRAPVPMGGSMVGYGLNHRDLRSACSASDGALPASFIDPTAVSFFVPVGEDGSASITLPAPLSHGCVTAIATDSGRVATARTWVDSSPIAHDTRYTTRYSADSSLVAGRDASLLGPGYLSEYTVQDAAGASTATYSSLARVHALFGALSGDTRLDKFSFLPEWDSMSDAAKLAKYSEFACHELAFFIYMRDRPLFNQHIYPFLCCKLEPTFVDLFLVGADLFPFLARKNTLNHFELILLAWWCKDHDRQASADAIIAQVSRTGPQSVSASDINRAFNYVFTSTDEDEEEEEEPCPEPQPEADEFDRELQLEGESFDDSSDNDDDADFFAPPPPPQAMPAMEMTCMLAHTGLSDISDHLDSMLDRGDEELCMASMPMKKGGRGLSLPKMKASRRNAKPMARGRGGRAMGSRSFEKMVEEHKKEQAPLFRQVEATKEYAEHNFYLTDSSPGLIAPSLFWSDWARHIIAKGPDAPFLSKHVALPAMYGTAPINAMLLALAVLGLPIEPAETVVTMERVGGAVRKTVAATGPTILWRKEVKVTKAEPTRDDLIISWRITDPADIRDEKPATVPTGASLVAGHVYSLEIVVTNIAPRSAHFDLLFQLPSGTIPVADGLISKTEHVSIDQYASYTTSTAFYFPLPGEFAAVPPHTSRGDELLARGATMPTLTVVDQSTESASWGFIASRGSLEDVVKFLGTSDLRGVDLTEVCWRCNDADAFDSIISALSARRVYCDELWMYSAKHNRAPALRAFLARSPLASPVRRGVGVEFTSGLLSVYDNSPVVSIKPIVPPRVHVDPQAAIPESIAQAYSALLARLVYTPRITPTDLLHLAYFLILEGKVDLAEEVYANASKQWRKTHRDAPDLTFEGKPAPVAFKCDVSGEIITGKRYASLIAPGKDVARSHRKEGAIGASMPLPTMEGLPHYPFIEVEPYRGLPGEIQFDYLGAYLDFISDSPNLAVARAAVHKYRDFPIEEWRRMFEAIGTQLAELDGTTPESQVESDETIDQTPELSLTIADRKCRIASRCIDTVELHFYRTSLERLFSKRPFFENVGMQPDILPHHSVTVQVTADSMEVKIPADVAESDCLIEASGGGLSSTALYMCGGLMLLPSVQSGQVRVVDSDQRPLAGVYVKVYAKTASSPAGQFHKDGFTDRRGWFDYASLSGAKADVEQYALFAHKEGSAVRIVEAPLS